MKKTALAVMVGTLAMAGTAHSETELGVGLGLHKMDFSRDVDNDVAGKISLVHRYDATPWGAEIAYTMFLRKTMPTHLSMRPCFRWMGFITLINKAAGSHIWLRHWEIRTDSSAGKDTMGLSTLVVALDMR